MGIQQFITNAQEYFPDLQVKYKDQSWLMKIISYIMFFNKDFMSYYITTIGSTVYFPNEAFVKMRPVSAPILLIHELVHIHDSKKIGRLLFSLLYLFPQVLALIFIPLMLVSWKLFLFLTIVSLLPIPAYFRMHYEKRAYLVSIYTLKSLEDRLHFSHDLNKQKDLYVSQFKESSYYFMYPFKSVDTAFNQALDKIQAGQRPFEDPLFDILDKLIAQV